MVGFSAGHELERVFEDLALCGSRSPVDEPSTGVNGGGDLLALGFIGRLKQGVTHAEGHGDGWRHAPGILQEVFKFIGFEMAVDESSIGVKRAAGGAGDRVIVLLGSLRDCSNEGGVGDLIGVAEAAVDLREAGAERGWIVGSVTQPVGVGAGVGVGVGVGAAIVLDAAPVASEAQRMRSLGPGETIGDVLDRHVDDGGERMRCGLIEKAENYPIRLAGADAAGRVALTDVPITQIVDDVGRGCPRVARSQSFGVVFRPCCGRLTGQVFQAA